MKPKDYTLLELDYDAEFDTLYLKSKEPYEYDVSIEANNGLILDVSKDKKITAFEILDATYFFDLKNTELVKANFEVNVVVTEDVIKIHFDVRAGESLNRNIKAVSGKALNSEYAGIGLYTYKYNYEG